MQTLILLACSLGLAWCAHDLSSYPFKATLNTAESGGLYELYWNFDNEKETISFAVRVETTGWVGFGLSPNGQMPNSDVVIGWVSGGETTFHDRFADARSPPSIDDQQDWEFEFGEEQNDFTIIGFRRNYITCDDQDLPITLETARVIWSFAGSDPTSEVLDFSNIHSHKGAQSINLLGGLPSAAPDPEDLEYYDVTVENATIPSKDTTYWCAAFRLPPNIRSQTRYITKFEPIVTEGNEAHAHHLLIYLCTGVTEDHVGNGGSCDGDVAREVQECRGGVLIAAWAVGGEAFVYPDNVAYPFGGPENSEFILLELHYDNPDLISGTLDSSGMRMWYTSVQREFDAGILFIGHYIHPYQVIPPNVKNFTTTTIATSDCTKEYIPEGGIHVFGNLLHTHVVGHGLTVEHIRYNSDCDVYEELEPIDRNLNYDFNFQQINHLKREVIVKPGDILQVKCFYGTEGVENVTVGGLSTRNEMCFSFFFYYPQIKQLNGVQSRLLDQEYFEFLSTFPSGQKILDGEIDYLEGLNTAGWDDDMVSRFQTLVSTGSQQTNCEGHDDSGIAQAVKFPEIGCPYIAPDQCSDSTPLTCCERIAATEATEDGVLQRASVALLLTLSLMAAILG